MNRKNGGLFVEIEKEYECEKRDTAKVWKGHGMGRKLFVLHFGNAV